MKNKPFFSIIIPCLNEEKNLPLLLEDYSNQTIQDFEIIVVDGHSNDKTVEKAQSFESILPSLKIVTSDIRNVSHQRNLGAKNASGEYLLFNDADNRIPKTFLEGLRYKLHLHFTDTFTTYILPDTKEASDRAIADYLNILLEAGKLLNTPHALGSMIGCHRTIFDKIGGFDPNVGFAEDTEFVRRACKKGFTFYLFREPRYVYSLRRFRKIGKLKLIQKYAILNLKFITNLKVDQKKEYPMGGNYEDDENSPLHYIHSIEKTINSQQKKLSRLKIWEKLKALLSLEED